MKLNEMKNYFYTKGIRPLRITACGGYMGCYGGSRDPEPDPYPKPGRGWQENNEGGGWDYYRYSFNTGINKNVMNNYIL